MVMCNLPFPICSTNRVTWNLPSNKMLHKLGAGNFRWCKQSQWTWPPHFQLILGSFLIDFWTPKHSCHLQMNTTSPYGLTSPYFRRCCFRCPNAGPIRSCEELEKSFHHVQPLKPSDTTTAVANRLLWAAGSAPNSKQLAPQPGNHAAPVSVRARHQHTKPQKGKTREHVFFISKEQLETEWHPILPGTKNCWQKLFHLYMPLFPDKYLHIPLQIRLSEWNMPYTRTHIFKECHWSTITRIMLINNYSGSLQVKFAE